MSKEGKTHPTREEHPLPAAVMHGIHLVALFGMIITGFFIHFPFYAGSMAANRTFHLTFVWIQLAVGVVRIYWAGFGSGSAAVGSRRKLPDYKWFLPEPENRGLTRETLRYYLFLRRTHPRVVKYNPLQKVTYAFWVILILIQLITGLALWTPTQGALQGLTYALGGPGIVRGIHYIINWVFIVTVGLHIYLVLAETSKELPVMFAWREPGE